MWNNDQPPLPRWVEDAYQSIECYLWEHTDQQSVTHTQATQLIAEANPDFSDTDIEHALELLRNRGWLYAVDDRLFMTEFQCADASKPDG